MKALVLGGSGFIGSHIVNRLLASGSSVAVLDVVEHSNALVKSYVGQLEDPDLLRSAIAGQDVVFHTVSTTVPGTSMSSIEFDISSNLISLVHVLETMIDRGVQRIVYLSSGGAVYGNPNSYPVDEEHPLNPISSYGVVKVASENYLNMFQQLHGLQPFIVRPANAYGPGQNLLKPQGVIGHFLARGLRGQKLEIWGDGSVRRDYVFISDLVDLIMLGVEQQAQGIFNVGAGQDFSILDILQVVENAFGRKLDVEFRDARACDVAKTCLDISKATNRLGWNPKVSLKDGVQSQLRSLASHTPN